METVIYINLIDYVCHIHIWLRDNRDQSVSQRCHERRSEILLTTSTDNIKKCAFTTRILDHFLCILMLVNYAFGYDNQKRSESPKHFGNVNRKALN